MKENFIIINAGSTDDEAIINLNQISSIDADFFNNDFKIKMNNDDTYDLTEKEYEYIKMKIFNITKKVKENKLYFSTDKYEILDLK